LPPWQDDDTVVCPNRSSGFSYNDAVGKRPLCAGLQARVCFSTRQRPCGTKDAVCWTGAAASRLLLKGSTADRRPCCWCWYCCTAVPVAAAAASWCWCPAVIASRCYTEPEPPAASAAGGNRAPRETLDVVRCRTHALNDILATQNRCRCRPCAQHMAVRQKARRTRTLS
jgi:hypothetical protein